MPVPEAFRHWRTNPDRGPIWGLSWYLANELCKRFYRSHGIAPWVLAKDGLGYYGITLNSLKCRAAPKTSEPLGRLTIGGDVENWQTGAPGDHGLKALDMLRASASEEDLVRATIEHLRLPPMPRTSHVGCRHHRWGSSWELLHEIATLLALRHEPGELAVWNDPAQVSRIASALDPKHAMSEHPGWFVFDSGRRLVIRGDGIVLDGSSRSLWSDYMRGASADVLAGFVWDTISR